MKLRLISCLSVMLVLAGCQPTASQPPIPIGLIAPLSGGSAASGEAIQRGMLLAIDEVNQAGGVLGRPLTLLSRDVANDPDAGVKALNDLIDQERIVAVFGGLFSPVMLRQLDVVHQRQVPLINPWGSVTGITDNGRTPNFAFRVSVSDKYADEFLVRYAKEVVGAQRPAIIADTSPWGDSNVAGLTEWAQKTGLTVVAVERFAQGDTDMSAAVERLQAAGADAVWLIANAPEGAAIVRARAVLAWDVPIVSHWGISGGQFVENAGTENAEGVLTLQTYSFYGPQTPKGEALIRAYHARFKTQTVTDIRAPVGVAHGYDGVHLLARAMAKAGSTDGEQIRLALESLEPYDGLVKRYAPAFSADRHDALIADDYLMAVWQNGQLIPAPHPRLGP